MEVQILVVLDNGDMLSSDWFTGSKEQIKEFSQTVRYIHQLDYFSMQQDGRDLHINRDKIAWIKIIEE